MAGNPCVFGIFYREKRGAGKYFKDQIQSNKEEVKNYA